MPTNIKLLLTENVEALGIVGDVVNVRTGYARNFLLPRDLATQPSEEKIKALASKRAEAEKMLAELRKKREELNKKLQGIEVHLIRSCNDQGILYGAITQQDVASALKEQGHDVKPRDVRINQVIKRIDAYDVHVKLDSDLDSIIKLWVVADRKLDLEKAKEEQHAAEGAEGGQHEHADHKGDHKGEKADHKPEHKVEKAPKAEKSAEKHAEKSEKADDKKPKSKKKDSEADAKPTAKDTKGTFARPEPAPVFDTGRKPRRSRD